MTSKGDENLTHGEGGIPQAKPERLRAILRAPADIQELYESGECHR